MRIYQQILTIFGLKMAFSFIIIYINKSKANIYAGLYNLPCSLKGCRTPPKKVDHSYKEGENGRKQGH